MGERTNGYITIVAGMPESAAPPVDRRVTDERKRELAVRLRKQGWSYRRISGALDVSYHHVQDWLDEAPASPVPIVLASLPARARSGPPPAAANESAAPALLVTRDELLARLEQLAAAQREQTAAIAQLEKTLLTAVKAEAKSWGQRILNAVKSLAGKGKSDSGA